MVYSNNFVVALKSQGKVLREKQDEVYLPFGSEYEIRLKNLDDRRAVVSIDIDGQDVLDGEDLVIDGNSTFDLRGFMEGYNVKRRFRFIEKNRAISEFRGDRAEDGIVTVKVRHEISKPNWFSLPQIRGPQIGGGQIGRGGWGSGGGGGGNQVYYTNHVTHCADPGQLMGSSDMTIGCSLGNVTMDVNANEDGITVEGSKTHQGFTTTQVGELSSATTICLKLIGGHGEQKITEPFYATRRVTCKHCGRRNSTNWNNCPGCGAAILAE
jgi:hypothetical protein